MSGNGAKLDAWVISKIETEYPEDVCLLLGGYKQNLKKLSFDNELDEEFSYYIPATNRANGLARTFIIDGIGYDLYPRLWEQIEDMANVQYQTKCLADAKILWARSEEDRQRYLSLQARLRANLQNPHHMLERAKKWFEAAKDMFQEGFFEERMYKVREQMGHTCDFLAITVACVNGQYLQNWQTSQTEQLSRMKKVPQGFAELYNAIIAEPSAEEQKKLGYKLVKLTEAFLKEQEKGCANRNTPDFAELAFWYQELCYTWRRVYYWCGKNNHVNAYMWCCMLQNEADKWGKEFGIEDTDMLGFFNANNLAAFRERAEQVEQNFRLAIEQSGVKLDEYATVDEFLNKN